MWSECLGWNKQQELLELGCVVLATKDEMKENSGRLKISQGQGNMQTEFCGRVNLCNKITT
jgi:hypothetical protein